MKRKISLLMAFMMAATLVPATPSFASTTNNVNRVTSTTYSDGLDEGGTILSRRPLTSTMISSTPTVNLNVILAKQKAEAANTALTQAIEKQAKAEKVLVAASELDNARKAVEDKAAKLLEEKEVFKKIKTDLTTDKDAAGVTANLKTQAEKITGAGTNAGTLDTIVDTFKGTVDSKLLADNKTAVTTAAVDNSAVNSENNTDIKTVVTTDAVAGNNNDAKVVNGIDKAKVSAEKIVKLAQEVKDLSDNYDTAFGNLGTALKTYDGTAFATADANQDISKYDTAVEAGALVTNEMADVATAKKAVEDAEKAYKEALKDSGDTTVTPRENVEYSVIPDVNIRIASDDKTKESLRINEIFELHLEGGAEWEYSDSKWTQLNSLGFVLGQKYTKAELDNAKVPAGEYDPVAGTIYYTPNKAAYEVKKQTSGILEVRMLTTLDNQAGARYELAGINIPIYVNLSSASNGAQKVLVVSKGTRATEGSYTYANLADEAVKMRVTKKEKISRTGQNRVDVILDEVTKNAFAKENEVTLRLPKNFTWNKETKVENADFVISEDGRDITLTKLVNSSDKLDSVYIKAIIDADRNAPLGDVDVTVKKGNIAPSSLVVAEYVNDVVTVKAKKVLDVIAGKDEYGKYKAVVEIEENVANSLLNGKYMEFTLENASVQDGEQMKLAKLAGAAEFAIDTKSADFFVQEGYQLKEASIVTSRTKDNVAGDNWDLRVQRDTKDKQKAKYELTIPFVVDAGFTGDLILNVKGAGVVGDAKNGGVDVKIANVKAPVTFEVANPLPQVKIGLQHQVASNITIKETEAGALQDYTPEKAYVDGSSKEVYTYVKSTAGDYFVINGKYAKLTDAQKVAKLNNGEFVYPRDERYAVIERSYVGTRRTNVKDSDSSFAPYFIRSTKKDFGLKFDKATVKRTDGDILLNDKESGKAEGSKSIEVAVDRRSTKASTIVVSDIAVTLDRTVPYGEVKLNGDFGIVAERHNLDDTVKKFDYFTTVTPVANDKRITTVFTIDQKGYSEVSGKDRDDKTMEVAPFIQDNRTMLPVRYVANAIGATVNYDPTTRTATFEKNQIVVSINIDKDVMYVNGSPVKLFTKPANVEGRIFLSVANVAQAFGLKHGETIIWNAENKTVTILPQDATAEEIKLAQEGKTLEGTTTTQEAKPEEKKAEETKPEEKKPEVKPEEKPAEKPAV